MPNSLEIPYFLFFSFSLFYADSDLDADSDRRVPCSVFSFVAG